MNQYLELYDEARDLLCKHSAPVMNAERDAARTLCEQIGMPTCKDEAWRYTDVASAFAPNYGLNLSRLDIPVNPYEAFRCDVPNLSTSVYFVINDVFNTTHQPQAQLPEGVIVDSLRHAATSQPELIARYYNRLQSTTNDNNRPSPITTLNTMLAQDGLFVYVPKGVKCTRPIQVVNILRADVDLMVNRRILVVIEDGAEATLLFCDHTADKRNFLVTQVDEVFVGNNACLQCYCLEENSNSVHRFTHTYTRQATESTYTHAVITLNTGISANRINVEMTGSHAIANLYGAVIADGQQHIDNNTVIVHNAPDCTSHQLYKYILDEQAVGAFAGRILVPHDMQHAESSMTNANLIGDRTARIYTQPMLEIYADDVKCAHGSTVGQLNDAALFYMRQRGISDDEARVLLKQAFASEVINALTLEPLSDRLHYLIEKRFRGELSHCEGCKLCK